MLQFSQMAATWESVFVKSLPYYAAFPQLHFGPYKLMGCCFKVELLKGKSFLHLFFRPSPPLGIETFFFPWDRSSSNLSLSLFKLFMGSQVFQ